MGYKKLRLYYWIAKAYLVKNARFMALSFLCPLLLLAVYIYFSTDIISYFTMQKKVIGIAGSYTLSDLPPRIMSQLTTPLLYKNAEGTYESKILESWSVDPDYTHFEFVLRPDLTFTDGVKFTSSHITYTFRDVDVDTTDQTRIRYTLKKSFPYFLDYLDKPIYTIDPFRGVQGEYLITGSKLNTTQDKLDQITLSPLDTARQTLIYRFYRSESDMITAFKLQEIDEFVTDNRTAYENFQKWPQTSVKQESDLNRVVTLFFNTTHPLLKEKNLREALYGSLSIDLLKKHGTLAVSPLSPLSPYYDRSIARIPENPEVNQSILKRSFTESSEEAKFKFFTSVDLLDIANTVRDLISAAGGDTELDVTGLQKGDTFDLLLGLWSIPTESNQYFVWHSSQKGKGNITKYENQRVDRLLEAYRATSEAKLQKKTMEDFQKLISRELPAAFLYYPYQYTITRKR